MKQLGSREAFHVSARKKINSKDARIYFMNSIKISIAFLKFIHGT